MVAVTLKEYWVYPKAGEFVSVTMVTPAKVAEKLFGVPGSAASQKDTL